MGNASLRVSSGAKKIEVNDDGEYITLNPGNAKLVSGFGELKKSLEAKAAAFKVEAEKIASLDIPEDEKTIQVLSLNCATHSQIMSEVDALIGPGTCRKVFGDGVVPDSVLFIEFFEALAPFIKEIAADQAGKMSKYSAARTGGV